MRLLVRLSIVAYVLLALAPVSRDADNRRDGNWWRGLSTEQKYSFATGFFDGMSLGRSFSYWGILEKDKTDTSGVAKCAGSYDDMAKGYLSNVTNGQISDG